jgi:hypothetical protein
MSVKMGSRLLHPHLEQYLEGLGSRNLSVAETRDVLIESCLAWFTMALRLGDVSQPKARRVLGLLEKQLKHMTADQIVHSLNEVMLSRRTNPAPMN